MHAAWPGDEVLSPIKTCL